MAFLRLISLGVLVIGVIVGLSYTPPRWFAALGMDFWELPALNELLAKQQDRGEEIEEAIKDQKAKTKRKNQMIQDLLRQKISLREAIAITRQTTEEEILNLVIDSLEIDPADMETAVGVVLIHWVGRELDKNSPLALAIRTRLENELAELNYFCSDNGSQK